MRPRMEPILGNGLKGASTELTTDHCSKSFPRPSGRLYTARDRRTCGATDPARSDPLVPSERAGLIARRGPTDVELAPYPRRGRSLRPRFQVGLRADGADQGGVGVAVRRGRPAR